MAEASVGKACLAWSFLRSADPTNVVPKNDIESVIRTAVQSVASQNTTVVLTEPASDFSVALHQKVLRGDWSGLVYQVINP